METKEVSLARAAENEALLRSVNERVEALNRMFDLVTPYGSWICECARLDCVQRVDMTLAEYEALRQHPTRFVVAPGDEHLWPDVETVVERTPRYWIVEKVATAADVAAALDERTNSTPPVSPDRRRAFGLGGR
jgi:hypothetical protein